MLSTTAAESPLKTVKCYSKEKKAQSDISMAAEFFFYDKFMGGVDVHDQYRSEVLPSLRSKRWTWPVLIELIQSSVANTVIISNAVLTEGRKSSVKEFAIK